MQTVTRYERKLKADQIKYTI